MSTVPAFIVTDVPSVPEELRCKLVANLWKFALFPPQTLVDRFGKKPEEFAAALSETIVIPPAKPVCHQRLRRLREWWEFPERRGALGPQSCGIGNTIDFFSPPIVFVPVRAGNDGSCLARSLVQRLMDGSAGVQFDAGRELLVKMLIVRAHQCGVFAE